MSVNFAQLVVNDQFYLCLLDAWQVLTLKPSFQSSFSLLFLCRIHQYSLPKHHKQNIISILLQTSKLISDNKLLQHPICNQNVSSHLNTPILILTIWIFSKLGCQLKIPKILRKSLQRYHIFHIFPKITNKLFYYLKT